MIKLAWETPESVEDVRQRVQAAINLEFATLPPYLYALMSIPPGENLAARSRIYSIAMQEMVHMCLACNIMNAIGGSPSIVGPLYPGPLPGDLAHGLVIHLYPFSQQAIAQGMAIEEPEEPIDPPMAALGASMEESVPVTIGQYYHLLDQALAALPASAWTADRNQFDDSQFLVGNLFKVNTYDDAHRAITEIVSEGEGTPVTPDTPGSPLDFQNELAHYYRFWEIQKNLVLTKAENPVGYQWGPTTLGVDWGAVYPAISDPESYDFSQESQAVRDVQEACNTAYSAMVAALEQAFNGSRGQLGVAVRAMFDLRKAARAAFTTPLANGQVAGPAFRDLNAAGAFSNTPAEMGDAA